MDNILLTEVIAQAKLQSPIGHSQSDISIWVSLR